MVQLRDYQVRGIQELYDSIRNGSKRIAWVFPTGAGKSTITSRFVKACTKNNKRVLFFVHSKELVYQFSQRLMNQFHIPSGIIMAGVEPRRDRLVQVASVQTLVRRKLPEADVVIIDETHRAKAKTYQKILAGYPNAIIIGLTATPFRADGKGLDDVFETIVHPVKIRELIKKGFLVGTENSIYGPRESVNMDGVRTVAGDYDKKEMANRFSDIAITKGVVDNYKKHALGKKAIVFNVNVQHSKDMCDRFNAAGIPSAHLDGTTDKKERAQIISQFASGEIMVLHNVMLFTEGFDVPDTECVILNRATKSLAMYVQMVGRGLRPANDKSECVVLDHGENWLRHGFVEDYDSVPFSLKGVKKKKKDKEPKAKKCPNCERARRYFETKCACGYEFPRREKKVTFSEGTEFVAFDRDAMIVDRLLSVQYTKAFGSRATTKIPLSQLRIFALLRGYKTGWWYHTAIDEGYVDVVKEHPDSFRQVKFLVEMAETEAGTDELYKSIKKQAKGTPALERISA